MSTGQTPPSGGQQQPSQDRQRVPPPFTVEFGDGFLRNHTINTPPFQMVVRGAFDISRLAKRERDGKKYSMPSVGERAMRIPEFPGAAMSVDMRNRKVLLFDPLDSPAGKEHLEQYNQLAKSQAGFGLPQNLGPFRAIEHTLDHDQLKTLLLELERKIESKCLKVTDGEFPSSQQIESLPGHELYDPQSNSSGKPRYKKDLAEYNERLARAGII